MLLKKTYKELFWNGDTTIEQLCEEINKIPSTNLKAKVKNNNLVIEKKLFSDYFPFNWAHMASMSLCAKSEEIEPDSESIEFVIEMKILTKISIVINIAFLAIVAFLILKYFESPSRLAILLTLVAINIFNALILSLGVRNFIRNWDLYISNRKF